MSDFGYLPATKQSVTAQNDFAYRGGDRRLGPEYHENTHRPSESSRETSPPPMYCSTWNS
ncbi:hypothetical protein BDN70DRAFT_881499 [Pholiota conissans]|uniref:Uncharacterized protein n=1 Tax=Pholiota conissans TaxID=109636 RepID=A0A9P5YXU1_9AGAR|nr:hypothetical protein BDN70DRAFT_881499 [Pholiota conissans]